ncbi:MAG: TonB-dependent receptor [Bacteroidales bacterium]|nr:TonB-dependent receptor [Bacteroidales bacterium]
MKQAKLFISVLFMFLTVSLSAQKITVTGKVQDATTGEGIPLASVIVKGTMNGVSSSVEGDYTIDAKRNDVLVFSAIGYTTKEVAVSSAVINVVLEQDSEYLEETIVVAYGTASKSSFTGSAAVVKSDDIVKKIATNVTSALAGTTPGVQVISTSGDPAGNAATIRIRGIGSISASNAPLIVLDGSPYDGSISDINPSDVESMTVLKDAAASAIYGHRGANGVIIITTKKGATGDAQVKFDVRLGSNSRLVPNYDVITDPGQYYETHYRMMYNSYLYSGHTSAESYAFADKNLFNENNGGLGYLVYTIPDGEKLIGTNFKLNPNATLGYSDGEYYYIPDDWYKEAYHNSFRQEYNLSVSGNSGKFNYFASFGYLNDGGMVANSTYERFTGRVNVEYQAKEWFKFVTNLAYAHANSQHASYSSSYGSSGNIFYIVNNIAPIYPLYVRGADKEIMKNSQGNPLYDSNNTNFKRAAFVGNAVRDNAYDSDNSKSDVVNGKVGIVLTPVKGLNINANVAVTSDNTREVALSSIFGSAASTDGYAGVGNSGVLAINQQYLASYKTDFGGTKHSFDILAGYEQYNYTSNYHSGSNDHLFNPFVGELSNAKGTAAKSLSSYTNKYLTRGFLVRGQYDYAERYYAQASYRRDASSRFAVGHQWGNFWSVGASWVINKENWFRANFVDLLKLKISYGVQGNDNLGSFYPYSDQYSSSYNEGTGQYSVSLTYKGNPDLTWETSKSFNIGAEFEFFKGYLNGSIEYFSRKTVDLLYNKDVPLSSGNPTGYVPVNVGSVLNNGVEITLDGQFIRRKNFDWKWNLNLSHYANKIIALDPSIPEEGIIGSFYVRKVGGSIYQAYLYKFAGVNPQTGAAQYYYEREKVDEQGKPIKDDKGNVVTETDITETFSKASRYDCGSVIPKVYGGFGTSLKFFGVDISAQFSYQLGGKYYDGSYQALMHTNSGSQGQAWHKDALKAWTPENPNTNIPRLDGDTSVGQSAVDCYLVSSNYLSINNVTIGYTLPSKYTKKIGISALRIYATGENLALFTARKGLDPRYSSTMGLGSYTSNSGLNTGAYAAMRNITGGISITF